MQYRDNYYSAPIYYLAKLDRNIKVIYYEEIKKRISDSSLCALGQEYYNIHGESIQFH